MVIPLLLEENTYYYARELASLFAACRDPKQRPKMVSMNRMRESDIMTYEEIPNDGPVLVFLHGFPDTRTVWNKQIRALKNNYHILNFNLPDSDKRESYRPNFIISTIKYKMLKIVRKDPRKKFVLIGHDLGCFILEELGRQVPSLIQSQVFISGMSMAQFSLRRKSIKQMLKSWYVFVLQIPGAPELIKKVTSSPVLRPLYLYQELPRGLPHVRHLRSSIRTLFIFGNQDPFLEPVTEEECAKLYYNFMIRILDGGHWIQKEKPAAVIKCLEDFIAYSKEEEIHVP